MTLSELQSVLAGFQATPDQLVLPSAALAARSDAAEWTAVCGLLNATMAEATLTIGNIPGSVKAPIAGQSIVYSGTATLFPWSGDASLQTVLNVTATFTLDGAGNPQLAVQAVVNLGAAPSWSLAQSIDGLAETVLAAVLYTSAAFQLDSTAAAEQQLIFNATVAPQGPYSRVVAWFGLQNALTVSGVIDLRQPSLPVVAVRSVTQDHRSISSMAFDVGCAFGSGFDDLSDDGSGDYMQTAVATLSAAATLAGHATLEMSMPLDDAGGMLPMSMVNGPIPLTSLSDLQAFSGNAALDQIVSNQLPPVTGFVLKALEISIAAGVHGGSASGSIALDIAFVTAGWDVLPRGILTLQEIGVKVSLAYPAAAADVASAVLYGKALLADTAYLQATVAVPSLELSMGLDDGTSFSVADLMQQFMKKLTGTDYRPPVDMDVLRLDMTAGIRTGDFSFAGDVMTDWTVAFGGSLVTLSMDEIEFAMAYNGGALSGTLTAGFALRTTAPDGANGLQAEPALFHLTAALDTGTNGGWSVGAGMEAGSTLSVSDLLRNFLYPDTSQPVPGAAYGVPTLTVSTLDMGMGLTTSNVVREYSFAGAVEGGWTFQPFAGTGAVTLNVAAGMSLSGTRTVAANGSVSAWQTVGEVYGQLNVFGLDVGVGYSFAPNNSTLQFTVFYGDRGLAAALTQSPSKSNAQVRDTIVTVNFGNLSLGEILAYLVSLATPSRTVTLPAPWSVLYQINFRDLQLKVNLTTNDIGAAYALNFDAGFMRITKIGLLYRSVNGEGAVYLELEGSFLGQTYGEDNPLRWDATKPASAPAVPGAGPGLVDVTYLGMGQHVALTKPAAQLSNVEQVIGALKTAMKPVRGGGNPLSQPAASGLRFDGSSRWLFGVEATLLEGTVYFAGIFYDPRFYGALIKMAGPRAGSLAGLSFELSYAAVSTDIGRFSVAVTIPDRYRNWEFGEVSFTLGVVHVDVYTNGNFAVDAGFPARLDFRNSFTVEVFPYIGRGGFYLRVLNGVTSSRIPQANNGQFSPVLEAGIGLSVGVGKDLKIGPLTGTLNLELMGSFEGVLAPFFPNDRRLPGDTYYWLQGIAGVVGRVRGEVDFKVIKASVGATASASVMLTMQAHEPAVAALHIAFQTTASTEVGWWTVSYDFSVSFDEAITLGRRTNPQWTVGRSGGGNSGGRAARSLTAARVSAPVLRQQRTLYRAASLGRQRDAMELIQQSGVRAGRALKALPAMDVASTAWEPVAVFDGVLKTVQLFMAPSLTDAGPENGQPNSAGNTQQLVVLLMAHSADGAAGFPVLVEAFLRWAAAAGAGVEGGGKISRLQLQGLLDDLANLAFQAQIFAYANLTAFLQSNLKLQVLGYPQGDTPVLPAGGVFAPMVPEITLTVSNNSVGAVLASLSFLTYSRVTAQYLANLAALTGRARSGSDEPAAPPPMARGEEWPSLAQTVFCDYFALLTRATLQAAINLLSALPYRYPASDGPSLAAIAGEFADRNAGVPGGVTPQRIAEYNQNAPLAAGTTFTTEALPYAVRAGQTLDAVAAAAPRQAAALTGADVGYENRSVEGLLRAGATMTVPAFLYTPLPGDTDALVTAMFDVRNQGVRIAADVSWYVQALATLNPAIVWEDLADGDQLAVPLGYLDTTPAALPYPVHPGDTLELIAATLSRMNAAGDVYGAGAASAAYTVPAMQHVIAEGETFAGLAALFTGLAVEDLIAANTAEDILTPLATLWLPAYTAAIAVGDTLASLAALFDVVLDDLVGMIEFAAPVFAGGTVLTLRDVPQSSVDALVAALNDSGQTGAVAAQVSRFMMHGQAMPAPADAAFTSMTAAEVAQDGYAGPMRGLYALTGQQLPWSRVSPETVLTVALSNPGGAAWLTFGNTMVQPQDGVLPPNLQSLNPTLGSGVVPAGTVIVTAVSGDAVLSTADNFDDGRVPSQEISVAATATAMPLYEERGVHMNLQNAIAWQAATAPQLPNASDAHAPGGASVWPFPQTLQAAAHSGKDGTYGVFAVPVGVPGETEGTELRSYSWAVMVPFRIRRVQAPAPVNAANGPWLPETYQVIGADAADTDTLYALWTHLQQNAAAEAATQAFLLYAPSAASANSSGLVSDAAGDVVLLKTNLSTQTVEPAGSRSGRSVELSFAAPLSQPAAFTTLLWEAGVVSPGGFYLRYPVNGGLPGYLFDAEGKGTVYLVCLPGSQAASGVSGGALLPMNNCVIVGDNVDAGAFQLYAKETSADPKTLCVATVPVGTIGFNLLRTPTGELADSLFSMTGVVQYPGLSFSPLRPRDPAAAGKWFYESTFDVARLQRPNAVAQSCPALPPAKDDPYASVSATQTLSLTAMDLYGNTAAGPDAGSADRAFTAVTQTVGYTDKLIGLSEWPSATVSYTVQAGTPAPYLTVSAALQSNNYLPSSEVLTETALRSAALAAKRYAQIWYQLARPEITFSLSTTLHPLTMQTPALFSGVPLVNFVASAYVFTDQIARLGPVQLTPNADETLLAFCERTTVRREDLLANNQRLTANQVITGTCVVPLFERLLTGESLAEFAVRTGSSVAELVSLAYNLGLPVPAGTRLNTSARSFTVAEGQTLAGMAVAAGCTPGDIGTDNSGTAGLIADGATIEVRGLQIITASSTFASLVEQCGAAGIVTTAAEIANLVEEYAGFCVTGAAYAAAHAVLVEDTPLSTVIAASFGGDASAFIALNGSVPGVIAGNTALQTGTATVTPPDDVPLGRWVTGELGLSLAEFSGSASYALLNPATALTMPGMLDLTGLEAVAYTVPAGQTLASVAALFGVADADTLAAANRDLVGIFAGGQTGVLPVEVTETDSVATLWAKYPPAERPSEAAFLASVELLTLRTGAVLICPAPVVPPDCTTFAALGARFGVDAAALRIVNSATVGLFDPNTAITYVVNGVRTGFLIGQYGTNNNMRALLGEPQYLDLFLTPGKKFLLPPASAGVVLSLPPVLSLPNTITPLTAGMSFARPAEQVHPDFAAVPGVASVTAEIPPLSAGDPASPLPFAQGLEAAWPGTCRVAAGATGDGRPQLYVVRFDRPGAEGNAIQQVTLGAPPVYFALPPLCNQLVSRTVPVAFYASGAEAPLGGEEQELAFHDVDVETWAGAALSAIDLLLSPLYAPAAYAITAVDGVSEVFTQLVAAKGVLAGRIAARLASVADAAAGDVTDAQRTLADALKVSLVAGYSADAVIQLPATVTASFNAGDPQSCDTGGHRFAGQPQVSEFTLQADTTLNSLAAHWHVNPNAVADLLADTPNLLATGTVVAVGSGWTITTGQTLLDGMRELGCTTMAEFVAECGDTAIFLAGTPLSINGYSAETTESATLSAMADTLCIGVAAMAVANQDVAGLLTGTAWVGGRPYALDATMTLATLAAQVSGNATPVTVAELAVRLAAQPVLAAGVTLHVVTWVPQYALSAGSIGLDAPQSTLNLLLRVNQHAAHARLLLNLNFDLTGLAYKVEAAPFVEGYESSEWLQFLHPLSDPGMAAELATSIGQIAVPVALRAFPEAPRMLLQTRSASPGTDTATALSAVKLWDYAARFEVADAAQDLVRLTVGINFRQTRTVQLRAVSADPFDTLAAMMTNLPAIRSDLSNLLLPVAELQQKDAALAAARSAVQAVASYATSLAETWGDVRAGAAASAEAAAITPSQTFEFVMRSVLTFGAAEVPLFSAVALRPVNGSAWGPEGQLPQIAYVDAEGNAYDMARQDVPEGTVPQELIFTLSRPVPAGASRTLTIAYPALDLAAVQSARLSVAMTRNEDLSAGVATNPLFVAVTPVVSFSDIAMPTVVNRRRIVIGTRSGGSLSGAIAQLFAVLLGGAETALQQTLTASYCYPLAPPAEGEEEALEVALPLFLMPLFTYTDDIPAAIQDRLQGEIDKAHAAGAVLRFDLTVYSTALPGETPPLLHLSRLEYALT